MTIEDFCFMNGYPKKVEALLTYLGAETEDLKEWEIVYDSKTNPYQCWINKSEYEIYSSAEVEELIDFKAMKEADKALEKIPLELQDYFNYADYFMDANDLIEVTDVIKDAQEITFDFGTFYYVEIC